jgi:hypothetical protein
MNRPLGFLLVLPLVTLVGCQQREKQLYANVKGTVTFNGKPIDKGMITFALPGSPPTILNIVDGQFSGQALVGTNHIVVSAKKKNPRPTATLDKHAQTQIEGYKKYKTESKTGDPSPDFDATIDYIPPEWGPEGKQMRVVETGAANEFQFDIIGPKN